MYQRPVPPPTSREDIVRTSRRIQQAAAFGQYLEDTIDSRHVGSRFNEWRKPITDFGSNDAQWETNLKASPDFKCMDFDRKEWARSRDTVDEILEMILKDIKAYAQDYYGLQIERYIRQGSSREGLKVRAADEFDTLLQYHFEGFSWQAVSLRKDGKIIPEYCRLEVSRQLNWLQANCPKLYRAGVFEEDSSRGKVNLNARALHESVFMSMIDRSVQNITEKIREALDTGSCEVPFRISRKINPPSINITINLAPAVHQHFMRAGRLGEATTVSTIDVDIVPGLLVRNDNVPDPSIPSQRMDCPVYAVFKWQDESSVGPEVFGSKPDAIWRICTSGYEKHTLDLAAYNQRLRYVITALRILKTYFSETKSRAKAANQPPPPITTVLRSYFLKHIAFYIILYLGFLHTDAPVSGVVDALEYFMAFLNISLETGIIPHFFHSNKWITSLYPEFPEVKNQLRFNLLKGKTQEAIRQAKLSLDNHLMPALGFGFGRSPRAKLDQIKGEYRAAVSYGDFLGSF